MAALIYFLIQNTLIYLHLDSLKMTSAKYAKLMTGIRKIVRAINLESKRVQKDLNISIPQLLTLKYLQCSPNKKEHQPLPRLN